MVGNLEPMHMTSLKIFLFFYLRFTLAYKKNNTLKLSKSNLLEVEDELSEERWLKSKRPWLREGIMEETKTFISKNIFILSATYN